MYKFQEVLFGAEERPSEEAPKEERIAAIVAATEASLPANVLYPTAGSITEVDARTGRALEAIWLETAEIYGSEYAPELTHRESNPLCRGIYVFDRESEKDSYTVWDNSDGYALTAYASDHGVAVKAAHMVARNRIASTSIAHGETSTIQDVVHDLEMNAAQRIETRFKAALEQAVEDVKRDLIESAGSPQCDVDALSATALRLSALKSLSEMAENGSLPVDGMFIFLHAVGKLEIAETPEYLGALALRLADAAARTMCVDELALEEMASDDEFWETVDVQGLSGLEGACRAGADLESPRGADAPEESR